jgi:hypothetical protein
MALCEALDIVPEPNQPNKLRQGFVSLAETLLESICDVFPECSSSEGVLRVFRALVKGNEALEDKFLRHCHSAFRDHAEGLKERDEAVLFQMVESIDHLRDINIRAKWEDPDFLPESKQHLWQYVSALQTYANLYVSVPSQVMSKIEGVAGNLGHKLASGDLNLQEMDLNTIGRGLLEDMSPEELAKFEGNLPEIYQSLSDVAGCLTKGSGGGLDISALMTQLAQQSSGEEQKLDLTRVLQQLSAHMPPGSAKPEQLLSAVGPMLQSMQQDCGPKALKNKRRKGKQHGER